RIRDHRSCRAKFPRARSGRRSEAGQRGGGAAGQRRGEVIQWEERKPRAWYAPVEICTPRGIVGQVRSAPLPPCPAYWYWIYSGLGYSSRTCCGVIIGLSFL